MKRIILAFSLVTLVIGATSCTKDFTCTCTYVPSTIGQSNMVETNTVESKSRTLADIKCYEFETKYWNQDYDGTCTIGD